MIRTLAFSVLALSAMSPMASAACDISDTKCAVNGGKCNIKFRNRTGDSGGSDGGSNLDQRSSAQTVNVKARKRNGDKAGNKLSIEAAASGSMNFDKKAKKNFQDVRLYSKMNGDYVGAVIMSCEEIKAVLNGSGTCKIFHGTKHSSKTEKEFFIGYQCDGGNVGGPTGNHG